MLDGFDIPAHAWQYASSSADALDKLAHLHVDHSVSTCGCRRATCAKGAVHMTCLTATRIEVPGRALRVLTTQPYQVHCSNCPACAIMRCRHTHSHHVPDACAWLQVLSYQGEVRQGRPAIVAKLQEALQQQQQQSSSSSAGQGRRVWRVASVDSQQVAGVSCG